jgi:hypothetical protein
MTACRIPDESKWGEHNVSFAPSIDGTGSGTRVQRESEGSEKRTLLTLSGPAVSPSLLQLTEQAIRSRVELRDHVFKSRLLRLGLGKLCGNLGHVRLHQIGLSGR